MENEIERKFLLSYLPEEAFSGVKKEIIQGYLDNNLVIVLDDIEFSESGFIILKKSLKKIEIPKSDAHEISILINPVVRIRLTIQDEKEEAFITIKGKKVGLTAPEYEYSVPYGDALDIIKLSEYTLSKTRYVVPLNELKIEVDVFKDIKDLLIAEIEIPNEEYSLNLPKWLSDAITTEVSFDNDYANVNLAKNGLCKSKRSKTI